MRLSSTSRHIGRHALTASCVLELALGNKHSCLDRKFYSPLEMSVADDVLRGRLQGSTIESMDELRKFFVVSGKVKVVKVALEFVDSNEFGDHSTQVLSARKVHVAGGTEAGAPTVLHNPVGGSVADDHHLLVANDVVHAVGRIEDTAGVVLERRRHAKLWFAAVQYRTAVTF